MKLALATGCLLTAICARTATPEVANGTDYEKLFAAATFSLTEAIDKAVALPEAKECVVVNAEIEEEGGKIIYSIQLAKGQKILEVNFDVTNGAMQPVDVENEDKSAQAKAAKITVKQALETATKKKGTKAIEASLVMEGDKPIWQVNVWTAKKAEKLIRLWPNSNLCRLIPSIHGSFDSSARSIISSTPSRKHSSSNPIRSASARKTSTFDRHSPKGLIAWFETCK